MGYFKEFLIEQTGNHLETSVMQSVCELTEEEHNEIEFERDLFSLDIFEYSSRKKPVLTLVQS